MHLLITTLFLLHITPVRLQDILAVDTVLTTYSGSRTQSGASDGVVSVARFDLPFGIAFNSDRSIAVITDQQACVVRKIHLQRDPEEVTTLGGIAYECNYTDGVGVGDGDGTTRVSVFDSPRGVAYSPDDSYLLVVDQAGQAVRRYTSSDNTWDTVVTPTGLLRDAYDIAIDRYGSFALVTDPGSSIIIKFSLEDWSDYSILCGVNNTSGFVNGGFTVNKLFDPRGVVISRDTSFALFTDNSAVRKVFISSGDVATVVGNGVAGYADGNLSSGAMFSQPGGLAFLSSSSESSIVVADTNNHCLRRVVLSSGSVSTLAGDTVSATTDGTNTEAQMKSPLSVAMVYATDNDNDNDETNPLDYAFVTQKLVIRKATFEYTIATIEDEAASSNIFGNVMFYFLLAGALIAVLVLYYLYEYFLEKRRGVKYKMVKRRIEIRSKSSDNLHALESGNMSEGNDNYDNEDTDAGGDEEDETNIDDDVVEQDDVKEADPAGGGILDTKSDVKVVPSHHNHLLDPPPRRKPKESLEIEQRSNSDLKKSSPRPTDMSVKDVAKKDEDKLTDTPPTFLTASKKKRSIKSKSSKKDKEKSSSDEPKQSFWLNNDTKKKKKNKSDKNTAVASEDSVVRRSVSSTVAGASVKSSNSRANRSSGSTRALMSSMPPVNNSGSVDNPDHDLARQREIFEERKRKKLLKEKDRLEKIMQSGGGGGGAV